MILGLAGAGRSNGSAHVNVSRFRAQRSEFTGLGVAFPQG
jgi:hypothetical protein